MPSVTSLAILALAIGLLRAVQFFFSTTSGRRIPYPPGPTFLQTAFKWYRLGHTHSGIVPQWKTLADQRRRWGDYFHIGVLGSHVLVVNSYDVAVDLLERRGLKYSDRPVQTMLGVLGTWNASVGLSRYGEEWRIKRKLIHKTVNKSATQTREISDIVLSGARKGIRKLLKAPEDFDAHIRLAVGSSVLKLIYGINVEDGKHPLLLANERSIKCLGRAPFGKYLVDVVPILKHVHIPSWVPYITFHRIGKEFRDFRQEMLNPPFEHVKRLMASGEVYAHSMASAHLGQEDVNPEHVKLACGSVYNAGIATTLAAIRSVLLCLMLNPEAQAKVHDEIDALLGTGVKGVLTRLPDEDDLERLPYFGAVLKEAARWHVAAPTGLAHASVEDDVYNGYFIPKGTVVIPNQWGMSRDERYYDNPEEFRPERHLGDSPQLNPYEFTFGFGRRACVGQDFARAVMSMVCVSIVACFKVSYPVDENGNTVRPALKEGHAGISQTFECHIEPRSTAIAELIEASSE